MKVEWHKFDYDDKTMTAPETNALVWIMEEYYYNDVTIGFFDGVTFRIWEGIDDCYVSFWAPIVYPEAPQ